MNVKTHLVSLHRRYKNLEYHHHEQAEQSADITQRISHEARASVYTIDGRSWGIECKHIAKGNLPFSAFRPNEVENLSRKEDAGGVAVVAVRRDVPASDVYFPWYYIRDRIESGEHGSVKLEGLPTDILSVLEVVHP